MRPNCTPGCSNRGSRWWRCPDATLDYSGRTEARLLRRGPPPYLREIWRSPHWRLFAVADPSPLLSRPGFLRSVSTDRAELVLPRPGSYLLRIHFTPYWQLLAGRGAWSAPPGDWTRVLARSRGAFELGIGFSLSRVLSARPSLHLTIV